MPKRRPNGEGSYRKRPNGLWEYQIMLGYHPDGRRNIKSIYGKTQRELKQKVKVFLEEYEHGKQLDGRITFSEWADIWYKGMEGQVSATTYEGYLYSTRILKDYFSSMPIQDIRAIHVETFLKSLVDQGRSKSYITKLRGMLHQIMKKAEANDLIIKNPVAVADRIKTAEAYKPSMRDAFTIDEVKALMENLPHDRLGNSVRIMLGTGMRTQEVMGLEPRHIAKDGSMIRVEQAVTMVKGTPKIGPPKTKTSYRDIPVPDNLQWAAVALRQTTEKFIWHGERTELCNPSVFRKQYSKMLSDIPGVRPLSPHCCRHTYVSQLQAAGVDFETIQHLSGHANMDMTEHYLHVQREVKCSAVAKLNGLFSA